MRATIDRFGATRWAGHTSVALALAIVFQTAVRLDLGAQTSTPEIPDLVGVWNGGFSVRPVNGPTMPWVPGENFPVLNKRGLAYQGVFDEAIAPKYDCLPSSSPAIQYDPYMMEVVQWPDRVLLRYEKDDQLRTVWLDGYKLQAYACDAEDARRAVKYMIPKYR